MAFGVLVVLTPVSGLPLGMRATLEFILGIAVFLVGLSLRMRDMRRAREALTSAPAFAPEPPVNAIHAEVFDVSASSDKANPPQTGAF